MYGHAYSKPYSNFTMTALSRKGEATAIATCAVKRTKLRLWVTRWRPSDFYGGPLILHKL